MHLSLAATGSATLAMGKLSETLKSWITPLPPPDEHITARGVEWDARGAMVSCMFCDFAEQKKEKHLLFRDDLVVAFSPLKDAAKQHILVIPRRHISTVGDLTEADTKVLDRMRAVAKDLLKCDEAETQLSFHIPPWNSIDHLHLHAFEKPFASWWQSMRFAEGKPWCASFEKVREWAESTAVEEGRPPLSRLERVASVRNEEKHAADFAEEQAVDTESEEKQAPLSMQEV